MRKSRLRSRLFLFFKAISILIGTVCLTLGSEAQVLTWNPAQSLTGPSDGGGTWLGSGVWWNGTANVNGTWSGTTPNSAAFGAGTPGNYTVTLSSSVIASNVTFNTSGYTLTGSPLTILAANGTAGITNAVGVTNQIAVVMTNTTGWEISLGANSQITLSGGAVTLSGNNPRFLGSSLATSIVNITNGTYNESGTFDFNGVTANLSGGSTAVNGPSRVDIGSASAGTVNVFGYGQLNANTGIDNDTNSNLQISRGQVAILNVLTNGMVSTLNNSTYPGGNLVVVPDSSSQGTLNVWPGGIVNLGTGPTGIPGINNADLCSIIILGGNKSTIGTTFSSGASGIVNISGGVVTVQGIQFGSYGGVYTANPTAQFNLTNGTVYLGNQGIGLGTGVTGFTSPAITLAGGTLGAMANWSSAMAMTLANGNVTLQEADANGSANNVTLSGVLSGNGSLNKTGAGILTLTATNTYTGATTVSAGTLALSTASTGVGAYTVGSNAVLNLEAASLGSSLNASSLTLSNGAILTLSPNTFGNLTAPLINVAGTLNPASPVTVNFDASGLPDGQYPLIKYGSLGGAGFSAFALGTVTLPAGTAGTATLVNDTGNRSLDLSLVTNATPVLKWNGTVNGNWDIGLTANWQTNVYYTQSNGVGPEVIFDDTAQGPNTAMVLNTNVSPAAVVISNSILNYSINGSGGIAGSESLLKEGTGTLTLGGNNSYQGGTTINQGTLTLGPTNNAAMAYTVNGGMLNVVLPARNFSLAMSSLTLGSNAPQLSFNLGNLANIGAPAINVSGNLVMAGNVVVNVTNTPLTAEEVLLQYSGTRSGSGSFVAGSIPAGATIVDDEASQQVELVYQLGPRVVVPVYNTNEMVVAVTTPQEYGAVGDGITDDSGAFQAAINTVYNSGGNGGGVIYVPPGQYAFYTNITVPTGVTLHGDWTDWTKGNNGLVGTTFKVYFGAGQSNGTPFITMQRSTALKDINIWYPNQNPNSITGYPFTVELGDDSVVQNVVLVNSYQGLLCDGAEFILSSVIGTPLAMGLMTTNVIADVCHSQDIRFSPAVWPASGLTNAPAVGGAYATWMFNNGEGMRLLRIDGFMCMDTYISGYGTGIEANYGIEGSPGATFYNGAVTNCGVALLAEEMPRGLGLMFANFTLSGNIGILRTNTADDADMQFERCTIMGSNMAVNAEGEDWGSWMQFQNCAISNALNLTGPGVFNVVDSTLLGSTQCIMSASATRAAFTGCTFSPVQKIVNNGNSGNLLINAQQSFSNSSTFPELDWTNILDNYKSRRAATTNLFIATSYGATGNGVTDDTAAIRSALTAAGNNGGGIVYLPPGQYHLTNTLEVPTGVELRGPFETRHGTWPASDGYEKGSILSPYGGQGSTNGPPAIGLETNSGLVGVTICYQTQNTSCIPFPPAIQGQGGNVYVIGVQCPDPYWYIDFNTYTCTNHLVEMVDGWQLWRGYVVGNGSSGIITLCHGNWTFWIDNSGVGQNQLTGNSQLQAPVYDFVATNELTYVFGNCQETVAKVFNWGGGTFMDMIAQNGQGPNLTMIEPFCDGTSQGITLDAAAPCTISDVNTPLCCANFAGLASLDTVSTFITSTTNFQGTARFFNLAMYPNDTYLEFNINGGDVGLESATINSSVNGARVNGGVLHLVNLSSYLNNNNVPYNLQFGPDAGIAGKTNELIGCYTYDGFSYVNASTNSNPVNVWNDYALSNYTVLNPNTPAIYNAYPNGSTLFTYTNELVFGVAAPNGVAPSNIVVTLNGTTITNLTFSGTTNSWTIAYPFLGVNAFYTVTIKVTDSTGQVVSNTVSFDTFNPANYTWEASDWNYSNVVSGLYIDNPQTNAYVNLYSTAGIDFSNSVLNQGSASYRPQGLENEQCDDVVRPAYGTGDIDYDVGFNNGGSGNWGDYTRHYPAGIYYVYMRAASPNGSPYTTNSTSMSLVTSGFGTANQTTTNLGTFSIPNTGNWQAYTWIPLKNSQGSMVQMTNSGSAQTFRITVKNGGYNVNFYALVPVSTFPNAIWLAATEQDGSIAISFPTQVGFNYQLQYTSNLTDPSWTPLGGLIPGNDSVQTVDEPIGSGAFYRVVVQANP